MNLFNSWDIGLVFIIIHILRDTSSQIIYHEFAHSIPDRIFLLVGVWCPCSPSQPLALLLGVRDLLEAPGLLRLGEEISGEDSLLTNGFFKGLSFPSLSDFAFVLNVSFLGLGLASLELAKNSFCMVIFLVFVLLGVRDLHGEAGSGDDSVSYVNFLGQQRCLLGVVIISCPSGETLGSRYFTGSSFFLDDLRGVESVTPNLGVLCCLSDFLGFRVH